jgi:hypothetical protein
MLAAGVPYKEFSMSPRFRPGVAVIGCVAGVSIAIADTATFTYDALGRLNQVQISGGPMQGAQEIFQYDAAGNRYSHQVTGVPALPPTSLTPDSTNLNVFGAGDVVLSLNVGSGSAGGTVSLSFNDVFVGVAPVIDGVVRISFQGIAPGHYTVRAIYTGDGSHRPVTSTFEVEVRDLSWLPAVLEMLLD